MSKQTQCPPPRSYLCPKFQDCQKPNGRSSRIRDSTDTDEYDYMRSNGYRSDRTYKSNGQDSSFGLNIDAQTMNALSSLREKACRFLRSDTEEMGTEYSDYRPPYSFESQRENVEKNYLRRAKDIDYVPESEFLRKMKQQCQYLRDSQPNVFSFLDDNDRNDISTSEFQKYTDNSYKSSKMEEQPSRYPPQGDYCVTDDILEENFDEGKIYRNTTQTKSRGGERGSKGEGENLPAGNKCTCEKCEKLKRLLEEVKTEHVSRPKKRNNERKERKERKEKKRKPGSATKPEAEQFEPNLKRPHADSCERCWRYASPARSPVNKPDQKHDPNFRRGHSCVTLNKGEDIDASGKHINPCKNVQPVSREKEERDPVTRPKSSPPQTILKRYPQPAQHQYTQSKSAGIQYPPSSFDQQTYKMPPPTQQCTASLPESGLAYKYVPTPSPPQYYSRKYGSPPPPQPPQQPWCAQKYVSTPAGPPPPQQYISQQYSTIPPLSQQYVSDKHLCIPPPSQQYSSSFPPFSQQYKSSIPPPLQPYKSSSLQQSYQSPSVQQPYKSPPVQQPYRSPLDQQPYKSSSVSHSPLEQIGPPKSTPTLLKKSPRPEHYSQPKPPPTPPPQTVSKRQSLPSKSAEICTSRPQTAENTNRFDRGMICSEPRPRPKSCIPDDLPRKLHRFPGMDDLDLTEYLTLQRKPKEQQSGNLSSGSRGTKSSPSSAETEAQYSRPCSTRSPTRGTLKTIPEGGSPSRSKTPTPKSKNDGKQKHKSGKSPRRRGSPKPDSTTSKSSTKSPKQACVKKSKSKSPSSKSPKKSPPKEMPSLRKGGRISFEEEGPPPCPEPQEPDELPPDDYYQFVEEPPRAICEQYDSPHPVRECACPPRIPHCCGNDPNDKILCCHCDWEMNLRNHPVEKPQIPTNPRFDLAYQPYDPCERKGRPEPLRGREESFQGRTMPCPYRKFTNKCAGLSEPQSSTFGSLPKNLKEYRMPPNGYNKAPPVECAAPRKYTVMYMTEMKGRKGDDVEVLVEELTQECPGKTDKRTKDITEKMKKIMECPTDSMALRFQKGVSETCRTPRSTRTLYF